MRQHGCLDRVQRGVCRCRHGGVADCRPHLAQEVSEVAVVVVVGAVELGGAFGGSFQRRDDAGAGCQRGLDEGVERASQAGQGAGLGGRQRGVCFAGIACAVGVDHRAGQVVGGHVRAGRQLAQEVLVLPAVARLQFLRADHHVGQAAQFPGLLQHALQAGVEADEVEAADHRGVHRFLHFTQAEVVAVAAVVPGRAREAAAVVPDDQRVVLGGPAGHAGIDEVGERLRIAGVDLAEAGQRRADGGQAGVVGDGAAARVGPVAVAGVVAGGAVDQRHHVDAGGQHHRLHLVEVGHGELLEVVVGRHVDHHRPAVAAAGRGGLEVEVGWRGDAGEAVARQVLDHACAKGHRVVGARQQVRTGVQRHRVAAEADLAGVGDRDQLRGAAAAECDVAAAGLHRFAELDGEVGRHRHAAGVVGRAGALQGGCRSVGGGAGQLELVGAGRVAIGAGRNVVGAADGRGDGCQRVVAGAAVVVGGIRQRLALGVVDAQDHRVGQCQAAAARTQLGDAVGLAGAQRDLHPVHIARRVDAAGQRAVQRQRGGGGDVVGDVAGRRSGLHRHLVAAGAVVGRAHRHVVGAAGRGAEEVLGVERAVGVVVAGAGNDDTR